MNGPNWTKLSQSRPDRLKWTEHDRFDMFPIFIFFSLPLKFLSFKYIIQISRSLKNIITIIKTDYKITLDITQIIDKHI